MKLLLVYTLGLSLPFESLAFGVLSSPHQRCAVRVISRQPFYLSSESQQDSTSKDEAPQMDSMTEEEKEEIVGNLVADDEWNGLTLELSELVRLSIVEDLKKNTREFLGKDDYKVGTFYGKTVHRD